jgi:hypothetical protein
MTGYTVGRSTSFPWGIETEIHITTDGKPVASVTVMKWPKDEKEQAARGAHLVANHEAQLAEKPVVAVDREYVEKLLITKGLLVEGQKLEEVKSVVEITAEARR